MEFPGDSLSKKLQRFSTQKFETHPKLENSKKSRLGTKKMQASKPLVETTPNRLQSLSMILRGTGYFFQTQCRTLYIFFLESTFDFFQILCQNGPSGGL